MFWRINGAANLMAGDGINAFTERLPSLLVAFASLSSVVRLMRLWHQNRDDASDALLCAASLLMARPRNDCRIA